MKAMILAAGRGERMRPLTDHLPKPLLLVAGKPLIVHHIERLAAAGIVDIVINIAYLGDKIRQSLGDGSQWRVSIVYSEESEPLETAGALLHALPLLGDDPFLLVNGDVWTDINFATLSRRPLDDYLAGLVLVNNPGHNETGDFCLQQDGFEQHTVPQNDSSMFSVVTAKNASSKTYTFSGVAIIHPALIRSYSNKRSVFPLKEVFDEFIAQEKLGGLVYDGQWCDVGTPQRLESLNVTV